MAKTSFYVTIEPNWSAYGSGPDGGPKLAGIKAKRITQARPSGGRISEVVIKVALEIPDSAFYPLIPEATVVVPEAFAAAMPVVVAAIDPEMGLETEKDDA